MMSRVGGDVQWWGLKLPPRGVPPMWCVFMCGGGYDNSVFPACPKALVMWNFALHAL